MGVLKKKSIGLDISDRAVKIVELVDEGGKIKVGSMGYALVADGVVERGRIKDADALKKAIDAAGEHANPYSIKSRKVIFGLPESQVYTHIFELSSHELHERDALVAKEAQVSIPIKGDDLLSSYSVLWEEESKVEILLVAISKVVFQEWRVFFHGSDIDVVCYDVEMLALLRGLFVRRPANPLCVVDIGAQTTNIAIFSKRGLRHSYTLDIAGGTMTAAIAKDLQIQEEEAEKLKINIGLSDKKERIFFILVEIVQRIAESVRASIEYYTERTGEHVTSVVFVGSGSTLKGLIAYFKDELTIPVWLGESVLLRSSASLEYIEAIGCALRGLSLIHI